MIPLAASFSSGSTVIPRVCHIDASPISILILGGLLVALALYLGVRAGLRGGYRQTGLSKTCSTAISSTFLFGAPSYFFLWMFVCLPADWVTITLTDLTTALAEAATYAIVWAGGASLTCAPMSAFIAYNFGARHRITEELARQSLIARDSR